MKRSRLLLKGSLIAALIVVCIGLFGYSQLPSSDNLNAKFESQSTVEPEPEKITPKSLLKYVNEERAKRGVSSMKLDSRLNKSAQIKAEDMVKDNYFEHVDPVTGKEGYEYAFEQTGTSCTYISENLQEQLEPDFTAKDSVVSWMTSKAHKTAIIDKRYEITGFGISGNYVVEHFCDLR